MDTMKKKMEYDLRLPRKDTSTTIKPSGASPPWWALEEAPPSQGLLLKPGSGLGGLGKDSTPGDHSDLPAEGTTRSCHPTCQEPGTAGLFRCLVEGRLPPAAG